MTYDEHIKMAEMFAHQAEQMIKKNDSTHWEAQPPSSIYVERLDLMFKSELRETVIALHAMALTHATLANTLALAGKDRL